MITRRRGITGEGYEDARKNLLEYLWGSRRITENDYNELKRQHERRIP